MDGKDSTPEPHVGELKLTILEGKNLPAGDKEGTSDPFVKITVVGDKKWSFSTKVKNKCLSCTWNETFHVKKIKEFKWIDFLVCDKDTFGKDELGRATINPKTHKLSRWPQEFEVVLDHGGSITVSVQLSYTVDWMFAPLNGTLSLKVLECKGVQDKTSFGGKQNLYCKVKVMKETKKTSVAKKAGTEAKWTDDAMEFPIVDFVNSPKQDIVVTIEDEGVMMDSTLGTVDLPLSLLLSNKKQWWNVFTNRKANEKKGEVLIEAEFKGTGGYPKLKQGYHALKLATYGVGERQLDVTSVCLEYLKKGKLKLPTPADLNWIFCCDPYHNQTKMLELQVQEGGSKKKLLYEENGEEKS